MRVSNTGKRDGVEIIQVYAQDPAGVLPYVPFWKRLVGFTRCVIPAQTQKTCSVVVKKEDLACYDPSREEKMGIYAGSYKVSVGGASNTDSLVKEIVVNDVKGGKEEVMISPV